MSCSRRDILEMLASGTVAGLFSTRSASSQAQSQKIRVGYQLITWSRYYPVSWWDGCRDLAAVGFRGIEGENVICDIYDGREDEFRSQMKRYGMQLTALYSSCELQITRETARNFGDNLRAAAFLQSMGGKILVIGGYESPRPTDDDIKRLADTGNQLGRQSLERYSIRVAMHPHAGSLIQGRDEIGRLMELADPRYFNLVPDTAHLAMGGSDPVEVFRTYAKRIVHVHLKDYDPTPAAAGGRRGRMMPVGQGKIDFPALLGELRAVNYEGWMNIELDSSPTPRETAATIRKYVVDQLGLPL